MSKSALELSVLVRADLARSVCYMKADGCSDPSWFRTGRSTTGDIGACLSLNTLILSLGASFRLFTVVFLLRLLYSLEF